MRDAREAPRVRVAYRTGRGVMLRGNAEDVLDSDFGRPLRGKVQLILTSPPFPLNTKKRYGNLRGDEYVDWLSGFAPVFKRLLRPEGSIVIEVGNAWERGKPVMSTLAIKALLALLDAGKFHLCQQFVCYNPARLPGPAAWVNVERIRVKDAFTHVWWMSSSPRPDADNRRVLTPYSKSMQNLLVKRSYNSGKRPSEHRIGNSSFLRDNGGAIPPNVLEFANTSSNDTYLRYCRTNGLRPHPARMPIGLPLFFIKFLTRPRNLVLDPFAGSNTTGAAAEQLKRRWIAVEAREDYLAGSIGRFEHVNGAVST